jgi:enamine deaminase RidA (YjgF/YER057c/UK114 family)
MTRRLSSGGPWEQRYGYARVVVSGAHAWVSGCTSVVDSELVHDGDATGQAEVAFGNALLAVEAAGFAITDVVRTRMYVVDVVANGDAVASVHGRVFADATPATTLLGVAGLLDPRMLVEVELDAHREQA